MKIEKSNLARKNYVLMGDIVPVQKIGHWDYLKANYSDMVVLLRLDEFYFCLDQDAEALEKITGCDRETEGTRTMARFNFYSLDLYLHKIVKAGLRVAICDELENPEKMLFT